MNKSAVVIAADSAMTVNVNGGKLHYHGVSKVHGVSTAHPIAIMNYGSANFAGMPWETIIKQFRDKIRNHEQYASMEGYCDEFIRFMEEFVELNASNLDIGARNLENEGVENRQEDRESDIIGDGIQETYSRIFEKIRLKVDKIPQEKLKLFEVGKFGRAIEEAAGDKNLEVRRVMVFIATLSDLVGDIEGKLPENSRHERKFDISNEKYMNSYQDYLKKKLKNAGLLDFIITEFSGQFNLLERLCLLPLRAFRNGFMFRSKTGIILAGFGKSEVFPSVEKLKFGFCVVGKLLNSRKPYKVTSLAPCHVIPFGETETVKNFLDGISGQFETKLLETLGARAESRSDAHSTAPLPPKSCAGVPDIKTVLSEIKNKFREKILSTIALLPKHVIADIAENLVKITAIESHVRDIDASVGGTVSVAIISIGDGFVWINRPYYFDPAKNPHFFARYYGRRGDAVSPSSESLQ
jgi:hypothetical protein